MHLGPRAKQISIYTLLILGAATFYYLSNYFYTPTLWCDSCPPPKPSMFYEGLISTCISLVITLLIVVNITHKLKYQKKLMLILVFLVIILILLLTIKEPMAKAFCSLRERDEFPSVSKNTPGTYYVDCLRNFGVYNY